MSPLQEPGSTLRPRSTIRAKVGAGFLIHNRRGIPELRFRLDEAKLFRGKRPSGRGVFLLRRSNLGRRQYDELDLNLGELYLDFETSRSSWGRDRQLNIRVGRLDIPFVRGISEPQRD